MMARAYESPNPRLSPLPIEPPGATPSLSAAAKKKQEMYGGRGINMTDGYVWENSMDALKYGAGSPTVRAGVLRLLGQMPEIKVEQGTLDGQPVLTLVAGYPASSDAESLTINANTGMPIKYIGESVGVTINYTVTRVTLADVASGKF